MLVSISNRLMYYGKGSPTKLSSFHQPYLLCMGDRKLATKGERIKRIGEYETYNSWANPGKTRNVFRVYVDHPASTPQVAEELFDQGLNVMEFDIKYILRALTDIAVDKGLWLFDTKGKPESLKVLVYDIEDPDGFISIIGYYQFDIKFKSSVSLKHEEFKFEILEVPDEKALLEKYNKGLLKISQLVARSRNEEVINLHKFVLLVMDSQIMTGHNIYAYDNVKILDRIKYYMENKSLIPNSQVYNDFQRFVENYVYDHQSFNQKFMTKERTVFFYPTCLDTWPTAEKFFRYLDTPNFSLKKLAPALGFIIKNITYLTPDKIKPDITGMKYNRDDMMEQICLSILIIQQALPMAFVSNYPFEFLSTSGNIQMWDYMTMIRAYQRKVIFPLSVSPWHIAVDLKSAFPDKIVVSKQEIETYCRRSEVKGDLKKVGRYGIEMPNWVTLPRAVLDHLSVGGLPIKPQDLNSQYTMWYGIVEADVQGMYPNILISANACADKVWFAKKGEQPDDWVLFWEFDKETLKFLEHKVVKTVIGKMAYKIGVKVAKEKGLETYPMNGILKMIGEVRKRRKESNTMQNMYDSLKALRNAGTHGIQLAVKYGCRQFNMASGDLITSKGQAIMSDIYEEYQKRGIRTIYGDTDGIYAACYRSAFKVKGLTEALFLDDNLDALFGKKTKKVKFKRIITPQNKVIRIIKKLNKRWQKKLKYKDFAFEIDYTPAMIISMHKNYIKITIDEKTGGIKVKLKGANFTAQDKPNIAENTLKKIVIDTVKDNLEWEDEQTSAMKINSTIRRKLSSIAPHIQAEDVNIKDLVLIQNVKAPGYYKGGIYKERAEALEKLIGEFHGNVRLDFVVTKNALPGMDAKKNAYKPTVKPIAFMTPIDMIKDKSEIDYEWYRNMIIDYISGAFKFDRKAVKRFVGDGKTAQMDLASFM